MRRGAILLAALLALTAQRASGQAEPTPLPDVVSFVSMTVVNDTGEPVQEWVSGKQLKGSLRFAVGGREGQEVPVIVRVALEVGGPSDAPWADLFDGPLLPGEYSYSWDFTVPPPSKGRSGRLVWSVKARYYVPGRLLSWALGHQETQFLDFDGRTIPEIRANPGLANSTRQGVWVRNRQADRSYPIVPYH
jgi:hypothetical protein